MNHSERIAHAARQSRQLTQRMVKEAVEFYLQQLAEDMACGEWVEIPGIGKLQVVVEVGAGTLLLIQKTTPRKAISVRQRLRTRIRLSERFKQQCYRRNTNPEQPLG